MLLATAACGSDDDGGRAAAEDDGGGGGAASALPAPEGAIGSVTGMPANPGPGTSRIVPVEPAVGATAPVQSAPVDGTWTGGALADDAVIGNPDAGAPGSEADDPAAIAAPMIIVPEVPVQPVASDDGTVVPSDARDATTTTRPPIGTEAATESTTIVIEPDDTGGSG